RRSVDSVGPLRRTDPASTPFEIGGDAEDVVGLQGAPAPAAGPVRIELGGEAEEDLPGQVRRAILSASPGPGAPWRPCRSRSHQPERSFLPQALWTLLLALLRTF